MRTTVGELSPRQAEAVRFGLAHGGRMLCTDSAGQDKTLTALALAYEFREEWPVLVICPAARRRHWRDQIACWLGHAVPCSRVQVVSRGNAEVRDDALFVIVPYGLVTRSEQQCTASAGDYQVVICDESHRLRAPSDLRTGTVVPLLQRARRAVLVSGVPPTRSTAGLYAQLQAVLGVPVATFPRFAERYATSADCGAVEGRRRRRGMRRQVELGVLLHGVMLHRCGERKELPRPEIPCTRLGERLRRGLRRRLCASRPEFARAQPTAVAPFGEGDRSAEGVCAEADKASAITTGLSG